jgi:hypothetical protein
MSRRNRLFILLALFACVLGLLTGGVLGAEPPGLEVAKTAQERHTDKLLETPGVVGTAIGLGDDGQAVVQIFTERHGIKGLPDALDGVPVKVRVTGEIVAQSDPIDSHRPIRIGVSSGSERLYKSRGAWYCSGGTLGVWVTDGTDVYALSNNHVYALENKGQVDVDRILQPARIDLAETGCGTADQISAAVFGKLYDYVPIIFSPKAKNTVDAAIASVNAGTPIYSGTLPDGYGFPSSTTATAVNGQLVQKYGRTTGLTEGTVTGTDGTFLVSYSSGKAKFVNQVVVTGSSGAFSQGGDSGSLIVTQVTNNPVALLFAGSSTVTIGNPIDLVLEAFGDAGLTIDDTARTP